MKAPKLKLLLTLVLLGIFYSLIGFSQTTSTATNSSTAHKFYCVDARELGNPQKLQLASLQAIVNENSPVLFTIWDKEDLSWLKAMEKELGANCEQISVDDALARLGANARQVLYDPKQFWGITVATTVAGVNHAILTEWDLHRKTAFDCRNLWTSKAEAYRWALTELLPQCDHSQLAYLNEELFAIRDYAIQKKLFVLSLDPLNDPQDIELLNETLAKFPAQTRVFGWATGDYARKEMGQSPVAVEDALVSRLSSRGMMLIPSDFAANLSFYDQTAPYIGKLTQQHLDRDIQFQAGKRYVLLVNSDGDNVQFDLRGMRQEWEAFQKERPNIPRIPVAWTISPSLVDVAPAVLQIYYQEATAAGGLDEFVAGASGYAYVNPGSMSGVNLNGFVHLTQRACEQADISSIVILDNGGRPPAQVAYFINAYATANFNGLWLAAMPRYVGAMKGTAFLSERIRIGDKTGGEVAQDVKTQDIKSNGIDYPFFMIYGGITPEFLRDFRNNLDGSCVVVSPTEMADLIRQWNVSLNDGSR